MRKNLAAKLATMFGIGKCKIMPGTIGSFFGVIFYSTILSKINFWLALMVEILLLASSIIICDAAEKFFQEKDPSYIILDEFSAVPICFLGLPNIVPQKIPMFALLLSGFVIFRMFDIFKPFGIKKLQELHGGIGVVVDDVVAAIYTKLTLVAVCLAVK